MKKKIMKIPIISFFSFLLFLIFILFIFQPINNISDVNQNPEIIIKNEKDEEIMHYINNHPITPIELSLLDPKYIDLLLFIEDKTFYIHNGFNLQRMIKTISTNIINKKTYGASTITQQYIKNIYLNNSKKISRKLKELYYSIKLEQIATKDEILTGYLNCIYLGNNVYGLADGCKYYFSKSYQDISTEEMISLIALLNAPSYYSSNILEWNHKKNEIAKNLYHNNMITNDEYKKCLIDINIQINQNIYPSPLLYFCDATLNEFMNLNIKAKFNEKITIYTRYDSNINNIKIDTNGNIASIAVDKDGYYLSCIGDTNYNNSTYNIALNGKRDIGSTIKPLLYYEALKCGYKINKTHYSALYSFNYKGDIITIKNYASNYPNKQINMKTALATSDNIYAIKTHLDIGMKTLVNHLKKYGIQAEPIPSLALGSIGMSLYQLTKIYTQFFTEGSYLNLQFIEKITIDNKIAYISHKKAISLGNSKHFKQIKEIMNGLFDPLIPHSTARNIGSLLTSKCYGKSGLTDYDSYMIGFNDNILVAVWSGHLNNELLLDANIKKLPKEIFLKQMNSHKK